MVVVVREDVRREGRGVERAPLNQPAFAAELPVGIAASGTLCGSGFELETVLAGSGFELESRAQCSGFELETFGF